MGRTKTNFIHSCYDFDKEKNISTCKNCKSVIKGKHPTNLSKHYQANHDKHFQELVKKQKEGTTTILPSTSKNTGATQKRNSPTTVNKIVRVRLTQSELISACVELVTVNGRPFTLFEDSGMRRILNPVETALKMDRTINVPNIKQQIRAEALEIRNSIMTETKNKLISIKVDAATRLERSFLGINAQFIMNGKIELRTLAMVELTQAHTGQYLKEVIFDVLKKYEIKPNQIYTVTSDNGANMIKAIRMMSESENGVDTPTNTDEDEDKNVSELKETETEELLTDVIANTVGTDGNDKNNPIITGMRCAAHTLQLAVFDAIKLDKTTQTQLPKIRHLVKKLRNQTYSYLLKKDNCKKPILDCLTRWNSITDMIERLIEIKPFVLELEKNDDTVKPAIKQINWEITESILKSLLPSKIATKQFQSEQLTLTDFYSYWCRCKINTEKIQTNLAKSIVQCMNSREKALLQNNVILAAIFLDPRYKFILEKEDIDKAINHLTFLKAHLQHLTRENKTSPDLNNSPERRSSSSSSAEDEFDSFLKSKERSFEEITNKKVPELDCRKLENILLDYCKNQKRIDYKTNIFTFWNSMKDTYPDLYDLFVVVFGVPATQVSVERLFSTLKFILSPLRTNIKSPILEDQILLRVNRIFQNKSNNRNSCSNPDDKDAAEAGPSKKQMKLTHFF